MRLHWRNANLACEERVLGEGDMSTPRTLAPEPRSAVATARPIPEEAPVTMVT